MVLKRLAVHDLQNVKAHVYINGKTGKKYFNIKHGVEGINFGYWLGRVSSKVAIPVNDNDELELTGDIYTISAIRNNGEMLKDKLGNTVYSINKDYSTVHRKDILLFWEIPNLNYTDVEYSITGDVCEIGKGYTGKDRGDRIYKSPAPILEIYGNCTLEWHGYAPDGKKYGQKITYERDSNTPWSTPFVEEIKDTKCLE